MTDDPRRLEPARIEPADRKADFKPPMRWRWAVLLLLIVGGVATAFWFRHARQVDQLRTGMEALHQERVAPAAARITSFVDRVEEWTMQASEGVPEPWADPHLRIANLHDAQGVYLRLPAKAARSPEAIREAAGTMGRDAITRCLGIEPIPLRGLFQKMEFLSPRWLHGIHTESRVMRLRVMEDQLARHVRRDLPILLHTIQSDYFLLVLQHGESRSEGPVDVFLWDLKNGRPLLRTRVEAQGLLLPVRVDMGDSPGPRRKMDLRSPGAHDCSIAAEIKSLTGEPPLAARARTARALEEHEAAPVDPPQALEAEGSVPDPAADAGVAP